MTHLTMPKGRLAEEVVRLLNHLFELPVGEQLYAKEIKLLFDVLKMLSYPIIKIDSKTKFL